MSCHPYYSHVSKFILVPSGGKYRSNVLREGCGIPFSDEFKENSLNLEMCFNVSFLSPKGMTSF